MGILQRIRNLFRGGKPTRTPPSTTEQREPDAADDWITSKSWLFVASSDVSEALYDLDQQRLYIIFISERRAPDKSNMGYYEGVSEQTARDFYHSSSPGRMVWRLRAQGYVWHYEGNGFISPTGGQKQVIRQVSEHEPF